MANNILNTFYKYYDFKDYIKAEKCIRSIIQQGDHSAWSYTKLSSVLYEQKRYRSALRFSIRAYEIDKDNPITIWHYAAALFMNDEFNKAIILWKTLIKQGELSLGKRSTTMGILWGRRIVTDCYYWIGKSNYCNNNDSESFRFLNKYIELRRNGNPSLYKIVDAKRLIVEMGPLTA